ncbi:sodium/solute symporter [Bacillus sp. DTU_2020_1000418_1_SI_GHA_SEK_038]|uniref:sodium:solute symporter family protein n=1 Tax=Bacillus sp. DTU_2020_1000418_1_SI_GHA_SEK_038 TaxID=3077585 RepID=UPI0028E4AE7F|nr:sodium/solute symporter [Bacillus sp. DTU_2020_1000418_1_SI_GHA_SEK_038]WNS75779.1 sodium/solute symporter [Bacillus sp. DTU_2020_1000418_1_SI_GHA_SEK_038]
MFEISPAFFYVIIGYFIIILAIGLIAGKGNKTSEQHLVAGRSIGPVIGGAALAATQLSAGTFVGTIGVLYLTGASYLWYWPGLFAGWLVSAIWIAPKFQKFNGVTVPDYVEKRYNSKAAKVLAAVLIVVAYSVYLIAQYVAGGIILQMLFGLPMIWGAAITVGITTIYTMKGGMKATTYSDFIQAIIMGGCFFVAIPVLYSQAGGFTHVGNFLSELQPDLTGWHWRFRDLLGFALAFGLSVAIAPYELARMYTMKNKRTVRLAIGFSFIFQAVIGIGVGLAGFAIRSLYPVLNSADTASSIMAINILPPVIGALFMVAILAAIMSTVSGIIIVSSSAVSHDIYGMIKPNATDKQKMFVNKIAVVILSIIPLVFAIKPFDMVQFIVLVQASLVASFFFAVVVVGLNWKRATGTAALISMIGGVVTVLIWYILGKPFGLNEVIPGVLVSTILMFVCSLFTKPVPKESLAPFFKN